MNISEICSQIEKRSSIEKTSGRKLSIIDNYKARNFCEESMKYESNFDVGMYENSF